MHAQSLRSAIAATNNGTQEEHNEKWAEAQYDQAYDYYFKGDWLSAERHIRQAIEVCAFEPRYRLLCAQVFCARGWLSMALSELHTLKGIDPNNPGAHSLALLINAKMKDRAVAQPKKQTSTGTSWKAMFGWKN
jgi:hypothetical protein